MKLKKNFQQNTKKRNKKIIENIKFILPTCMSGNVYKYILLNVYVSKTKKKIDFSPIQYSASNTAIRIFEEEDTHAKEKIKRNIIEIAKYNSKGPVSTVNSKMAISNRFTFFFSSF